MRKKLWVAVLLSLCTASAATVHFTGRYNASEFERFSPYGPYVGTIDGDRTILYCNDKANEVRYGQTWQANLTPLSLDTDLGVTRYGALKNAAELYMQAAWLTTQYAVNPIAATDIQYTIWALFLNGTPKPSTNLWKQKASEQYQTILPNQFSIVTNVGPVRPTGQVQEFLTLTPAWTMPPQEPEAIPEPGTFMLMSGAVLVLAVRPRTLMQRLQHWRKG